MKPIIVLVQPQLGENIGKAARAMLNFGLTEMRLVAPRDGWPNPSAGPSASGANRVLDEVRVHNTVAQAISDCTYVYASTVRPRDMPKPVVTPREAAQQIHGFEKSGGKTAILFGRESSGLSNDDVAQADAVLTVPVNPDFGSLNLAQAVILLAYEYHSQHDQTPAYQPANSEGLADKSTLDGLHSHLVNELEPRGYFRSSDRQLHQERTLKNLIHNSEFSAQEVQTLRGVIKSLVRGRED